MPKWLNENDIGKLHRNGSEFYPADCKLTPSALDLARRLNLKPSPESSIPIIVIGSDHGGFKMKEQVKQSLQNQGYEVEDIGCFSEESVDYPDYAAAVGRAVASGKFNFGIMIDTYGTASAITANKIRGIRAACCPSAEIAASARSHNDANILTLGGKMDFEDVKGILEVFLNTKFSGGRHTRRVEKIKALER